MWKSPKRPPQIHLGSRQRCLIAIEHHKEYLVVEGYYLNSAEYDGTNNGNDDVVTDDFTGWCHASDGNGDDGFIIENPLGWQFWPIFTKEDL